MEEAGVEPGQCGCRGTQAHQLMFLFSRVKKISERKKINIDNQPRCHAENRQNYWWAPYTQSPHTLPVSFTY